MQKRTLFFAFFIVLTLTIHAQSEEDAVASAVEELRMGLLNPTREKLTSLTSEDLTYGHSSGTIEDQEEFVNALVSGKYKFTRIDPSNQSIKIVENLALVRHQLGIDVNGSTIDLGVLLVWKKEGTNWKLLARQAYRIN